jgi:septum formation protein
VLGVDTVVVCDGHQLGKPADRAEAGDMLAALAGRSHDVVSGFCLRTDGWEELHRVTTQVSFRPLAAGEIEHYLAAGEWEGRAGAYAIQGLGASLVERISGDYLNVVGLPAALLVSLLASRWPGHFGFGGGATHRG